jgi:hypothetical protein
MSVLKLFKKFYIYIKEKRELKEEYWHFEINSHQVSFRNKPHIFELYISVSEDKRTYFIEEQGTKKITQEEWDWFYKLLNAHNVDSLFIFRNNESINDFYETVSTGSKSKKLEELYKCVLEHKGSSHPIQRMSDSIEIKIKNKSYPVNLKFDWDEGGIILYSQRMKKSYNQIWEINKYFNKFK